MISAQDTFDNSTVVIKSYKKSAMKAAHIRNVQREIDVMVVLGDNDCRGVVRMLYAFEDEEHYHLVYEPEMRGDLYQMKTRQGGTLDENYVALSVIIPLLSTLSVLHSLHIVHRDIKAENIFVSSSGEIKLGDFGLAAHTIHDPLIDRVGTLDYMAPEVLSMPMPPGDPNTLPSTSDHATASAVIVTAFKGRTSCEGSEKRELIRKQLSKNSETIMPSELSNSSLSSCQRSPDISQLQSELSRQSSPSPRSSPGHEERTLSLHETLSRSSLPGSRPTSNTLRYNEKVDIWAVGVLAFELLVGRTPFEVDDPKETANLILTSSVSERFPSSSEMAQSARGEMLSSECRAFITAALEKRPDKRPSAAQLLSHEWLTSQTKKAWPNSATHRQHKVDVAIVGKAMNDAWGSSLKMQREDASRSISFTLQRAGPSVARSAGSMGDMGRLTPPSGTKRGCDPSVASTEKPPLPKSPFTSPLTTINLTAEALNSPELLKIGDGGNGSDSDQSNASEAQPESEVSQRSHAWQVTPPSSVQKTTPPLRKSRFAS